MKENDNLQLSQIQRILSPLRRLLPLGRRSCPKVCSFFAILAKGMPEYLPEYNITGNKIY
jgi:hypothetical protein